MSDDKPPMPPQPKTVSLEKPPDWAIALTEKMNAVHGEVMTVSENVELLQHDAKDTKLRLGRLERELDDVKERQTRNSSGVRSASEVDAKHDAAIGALVADVADVKSMLADNNNATDKILAHASSWAQKHPAVTTAFVQFVLAALAYATWRLQR